MTSYSDFQAFVDSLGVDSDEYHDGDEWWEGYRQAQRDLIRKATRALGESSPRWEYAAGYQADNGVELRWFSMGGGGYVVREVAENDVARFSDPQIILIRRPAPGAWEPVDDSEAAR